MTQFHKRPTNAFVNQAELMVSLVSHVDELKGTLKELKDDLKHLKDMKKDLRCIKYDYLCVQALIDIEEGENVRPISGDGKLNGIQKVTHFDNYKRRIPPTGLGHSQRRALAPVGARDSFDRRSRLSDLRPFHRQGQRHHRVRSLSIRGTSCDTLLPILVHVGRPTITGTGTGILSRVCSSTQCHLHYSSLFSWHSNKIFNIILFTKHF
jgi:hypothetical protein